MAVLIYSTNAPIDRMIPKGVTPAPPSDAAMGAVAGPDTSTS